MGSYLSSESILPEGSDNPTMMNPSTDIQRRWRSAIKERFTRRSDGLAVATAARQTSGWHDHARTRQREYRPRGSSHTISSPDAGRIPPPPAPDRNWRTARGSPPQIQRPPSTSITTQSLDPTKVGSPPTGNGSSPFSALPS